MMKAAINETEAVPAFEPKMTRSKLREVVEKGVVIPAWNISPIKKTRDVNKAPQFVDIPLAEEDSSDEEYHPDEEDEDETAEDTFQESDMESSSPRGTRPARLEEDSCSPWQTSRSRSRRLRAAAVSMGPPPPPKATPSRAVPDCTFLEKLHAVEEELSVCIDPYQPLPESEDAVGLMAYRTRSKRPLRNVPLGRLEAELRAPDITPDMYEFSSAHEDRDWTDWLRGLMTSDMENEEKEVNELMEELFETGALQLLEELRLTPISCQQQAPPPDSRGHKECDDEDDPEYNFLADTDEPDVEDYRDDKAVRITSQNMEGSCDPTKLVSQFLLRKTLVQVRRRILQCCRPGSPDNIVKAFRYQRVVRPMPVACRPVSPAERRPPVEREEEAMPLWLLVRHFLEADRSILTACQQRGANRKTFRQVSAHLGNKTAQQVSLRFSDLMKLFHKSTSCSSEGRPIGSREAALD
ncbi:GON-4-like protein [Liparis tanakae]|uniref:GON-4-like protein n=1 Tax=Liparis tanakae TaxID=230148 RepID=A0A4Z2GXF8_9TELE|nr:GON-4-like protein [Liparis tanakae]